MGRVRERCRPSRFETGNITITRDGTVKVLEPAETPREERAETQTEKQTEIRKRRQEFR
jgi:hypothetical protein